MLFDPADSLPFEERLQVVFTRVSNTTQARYRALANKTGIPLLHLLKMAFEMGVEEFQDNPAAFRAEMDPRWDKREAPYGFDPLRRKEG